MNWKLKANLQNLISLLPLSVSEPTYLFLQKTLGKLKHINPSRRFVAAIETCQAIKNVGHSYTGCTFLEIGTGRRINIPLAFWFLGAKKVITVDLNPYLREELVMQDISFIKKNKNEIEHLFGELIFDNRLNKLLDFTNTKYHLNELLDFCSIEYIAPCNAAHLPLVENSVDFYTSYTVLEHIPPRDLEEILKEGNRVIKDKGLFVHFIDYSDHFSHSTKSISPINFLRFSDDEWLKIVSNKYMYMNRLRHDDFMNMFQKAGNYILLEKPRVDEKVVNLIRKGHFKLEANFRDKSETVIATTGAWVVSQYRI